jgi:putative transposase
MPKDLLVEKHIIDKSHPFFKECGELCFKSKNLYNTVNYQIRQEFFENAKNGDYFPPDLLYLKQLYPIIQNSNEYLSLTLKVSQLVIQQVIHDWTSYYAALKEYYKNCSKFTGQPNIPKYKHKKEGRNICVYNIQAISKTKLKENILQLSQTNIQIKTKVNTTLIKQVVIKPVNKERYLILVIYENDKITTNNLNFNNIIAIDPGVNNFVSLTSNVRNYIPKIINGRGIKAFNQYYNKKKAEFQKQLTKGQTTSRKILNLGNKRNNHLNYKFHLISNYVINQCLENNVGTLVFGHNEFQKQEINLGKQNNQNFVQIPYVLLINILKYKCYNHGINFIITEESYTSKSSFIDNDILPVCEKDKHYSFSGKRIKRGMYQTKNKSLINADVNGSYNIIKKVNPKFKYDGGNSGTVVVPVKVNII